MDYWDIADSKLDVSGNFMEPRNTTSKQVLDIFGSINFKKLIYFKNL